MIKVILKNIQDWELSEQYEVLGLIYTRRKHKSLPLIAEHEEGDGFHLLYRITSAENEVFIESKSEIRNSSEMFIIFDDFSEKYICNDFTEQTTDLILVDNRRFA